MAEIWIQTCNKENKECKPVKTIINNLLTFSLSAHNWFHGVEKLCFDEVHEVMSCLK